MAEITERTLSISDGAQWSEEERKLAGCIMEPDELAGNCDALVGPDAESFAAEFVKGMFSLRIAGADLEFIVEETFQMPRLTAFTLLQNIATADFRDLIPRIECLHSSSVERKVLSPPHPRNGSRKASREPRSRSWKVTKVGAISCSGKVMRSSIAGSMTS